MKSQPEIIVPLAYRWYMCEDCEHVVQIQTNHRLPCYPVCKGKCRTIYNEHTEKEMVSGKQTTHVYLGDQRYYALDDNQCDMVMHTGRNATSLEQLKAELIGYLQSDDDSEDDLERYRGMDVQELAAGADMTIVTAYEPWPDEVA